MRANVFFHRRPVEPGPRKLRMVLVAVVFAGGLAGLMFRAWYLQVHRHDDWVRRSAVQHRTKITLRASRGAIHDRNGHPLALSAMMPSVYAVPRTIKDPAAVAKALAAILQVDPVRLERRLSTKRAFAWVKRLVDPRAAEAVLALEIRGVGLQKEAQQFLGSLEPLEST